MVYVSENNIIMYDSGDTFCYPLFINLGTKLNKEQYILREGDKVYFSIMEPHAEFECGLVRKIFDIDDLDKDGNVVISISPEDLEWLRPGVYYYEIKLSIYNGEAEEPTICTISPRQKFCIK